MVKGEVSHSETNGPGSGNEMPRYRKRPVVIEAVRFDPDGEHRLSLPEGVTGAPSPGADNWAYEGSRFYIDTLEGRMEVRRGDWVITGVQGEKYPCKDEIFRATYQPVDAVEGECGQ
jgi:hypothetical protein